MYFRIITNWGSIQTLKHMLGKICYGVEDTLKALDLGAVETLIIWENLEVTRYLFKNPVTGEEIVKHLNKEQEKVREHFVDAATGTDYEIVDKQSLLEWVCSIYYSAFFFLFFFWHWC
jgi:peptide chain release factor subunit 1